MPWPNFSFVVRGAFSLSLDFPEHLWKFEAGKMEFLLRRAARIHTSNDFHLTLLPVFLIRLFYVFFSCCVCQDWVQQKKIWRLSWNFHLKCEENFCISQLQAAENFLSLAYDPNFITTRASRIYVEWRKIAHKKFLKMNCFDVCARILLYLLG